MKKKILFFIALLMTASFLGCKDWLTIEPEGETVLEDFWQDETQVERVLAACYRAMTEKKFMLRVMMWGEIRSDNVVSGNGMSDNDMRSMMNFNLTASNKFCTWGCIYSVINYCNTFLYYAPDVVDLDEDFTQGDLKRLEAEVLTIRALCYFHLVRAFKDVPYITDASIDDTQDYTCAKMTEDSILINVKNDLYTALENARDRFDVAQYNKGRVNKNTVRALLADIALWQNDYQSCINYCDAIINTGEYELVEGEDVLTDVFYTGNSTESIFELQFDDDDMNNTMVANLYGSYSDETGEWAFPYVLWYGSKSIYDSEDNTDVTEYADNDRRKYDYLVPELILEKCYIFKYSGRLRSETTTSTSITGGARLYSSKTANWIVYRLADILLMKAEALIQQERLDEALQLINVTFLRANDTEEDPVDSLLISDFSTKNSMNNLLLRERQRELMFEGKRYYDLMRVARRENSTSTLLNYVEKKITSDSFQRDKLTVLNSLYLPIHQDELDANNELVQNPFYKIESGDISK